MGFFRYMTQGCEVRSGFLAHIPAVTPEEMDKFGFHCQEEKSEPMNKGLFCFVYYWAKVCSEKKSVVRLG